MALGPYYWALIAIILGFMWGGWITMGSAQTMSDEAVLASQAAICGAQFMKQPDREAKLKAFMNSWNKSEFVAKGGWDKMPGQAEAGATVTRACANGLERLGAK
jgi:alpha/beta superfamily hydrolase